MGVLEELAEADSILARRINALEKQPTGEDLKLQQDRLAVEQHRLEAEHQALGRRMHAIESESNQAQHGEIQALGRRVSAIEELGARVDSLRDALSSLIGQQAITQQEGLNVLKVELSVIRGQVGALTAALEGQRDNFSARMVMLEERESARIRWDAQPWYVRWWRRIKGERP